MKKVIALMLSLVMVLGLLAGCGNKQNDSDKKNDGKDYSNVKIGVMLAGIIMGLASAGLLGAVSALFAV